MPSLTLYRLLFDWELGDYVDEELGDPRITDVDGANVAYWRQASAPEGSPEWAAIVRGAFPGERFGPQPPKDSALLVVRVVVDGDAATWAMAFGTAARYWLVKAAIDREAHIHASVAALRDPQTGTLERLTGISAHEIGQYLQRISREIPTGGAIADFEYDYGAQVLRGAKGRPARDGAGKTVSGGESLRVSAIDTFGMALEAIRTYEALVRAERVAHGDRLPGPRPVSPDERPTLLNGLATLLLERNPDADIAIVLPDEMVDEPLVLSPIGTSDAATNHRDNGIEQPTINDLLGLLEAGNETDRFSGEYLRSARLKALNDPKAVPLLKTLAGRFVFDGDACLIDEAQIYHVPAGWLEALDARVDSCPTIADFIAYDVERHEDEAAYNRALARALRNAIVLDQRLVRGDAFSSGIEIADVARVYSHGGVDRVDLIHIKRGTKASKLSHLFTQVRTAMHALPLPSVRDSLYQRICEVTRNEALRRRFRKALAVRDTFLPARVRIVVGISTAWNPHRPTSTHLSVYGRQGLQQTIQDVARGGHEIAVARIAEE